MKTDTPETDKAAFKVHHTGLNNGWDTEQVYASLARKMERERDEMEEKVHKYEEALAAILRHATSPTCEYHSLEAIEDLAACF